MIDLSGQIVIITLNPASSAQYNTLTGVMTFTDLAGNTCNIVTPLPVQRPDKVWSTCWPRPCDP